jgi:transcriptional regulator with XRE-family HTH domain
MPAFIFSAGEFPMYPPLPVSRALYFERTSKGLSQTELAAASGVTARTISSIENNRTSPTKATCQRLAKALGIPLEKLVGEGK